MVLNVGLTLASSEGAVLTDGLPDELRLGFDEVDGKLDRAKLGAADTDGCDDNCELGLFEAFVGLGLIVGLDVGGLVSQLGSSTDVVYRPNGIFVNSNQPSLSVSVSATTSPLELCKYTVAPTNGVPSPRQG
jgi:hypothetical protein